jgi:hypothetical protein
MTDESPPKEPVATKAAKPEGNPTATDRDLSREIERAVEREPLDLVRCVRVYGDYYRCNWWASTGGHGARQQFNWSGMMTDFVRKSRFLNAKIDSGELVVEEIITGGGQRSLVRDAK